MTGVVFIGGPHDGLKADLIRTPPAVLVGELAYRRLDDPDTGEFLGGYFVSEPFTPFVPAEFAIEDVASPPLKKTPIRDAFRKSVIARFFILFYGLALLMAMGLYLAHEISVGWQ